MTILFISTNKMWGGSEELWYRSACALASQGIKTYAITNYENEKTKALKVAGVTHFIRPKPVLLSLLARIRQRLFPKPPAHETEFRRMFSDINPKFVLISQGSNIESVDVMELCSALNLPYATVTQLVAEVHYLWMYNEFGVQLRKAYNNAVANFFVSKNNIAVHNMMMGGETKNAAIVFNPFKSTSSSMPAYPESQDFRIAVVGRLECFHKGHDVLLRVLSTEKWKQRNLFCTFYGEGPHRELLESFCTQNKLHNVSFAGHVEDIFSVWEKNQLLVLASRMEGQSLALIEAMFCGRSAVVTNVGGAAELIEDGITGFLAQSSTISEMDAALDRAWAQREHWADIGKAAQERVRATYPPDPVAYFNEQLKRLLN